MHGWITCILIIETSATLRELLPAESSQLLLPILSTLCHSPSKVLSSPGPAGSWPGSTSPKWGLTVPRLSPRSPVNPIITLRGPAGCSRCHNSPNITATTSFQQPQGKLPVPEISSKLSKLSKRLPRSVVFGVWLSLHRAVRDRPGVWSEKEEGDPSNSLMVKSFPDLPTTPEKQSYKVPLWTLQCSAGQRKGAAKCKVQLGNLLKARKVL